MDTHRDAWAAGIVDGDGCITIKKRRHSKKKGASAYFQLHVIVGQSGDQIPAMLHQLQQDYEGSIGGGKPGGKENRMPKWNWTVASKKAETFLQRILPYLVEKKNQAELALDYRRLVIGTGSPRGADHQRLAAEFYWKLRQCKHYQQRSEYWKRSMKRDQSHPLLKGKRLEIATERVV